MAPVNSLSEHVERSTRSATVLRARSARVRGACYSRMVPNIRKETEKDSAVEFREKITIASPRKYDIVYWNVLVFLYYHLAACYGLYLCFTSAMWLTTLFNVGLFLLGGIGIVVGVHRLWSHKSFKATLPLQVFLMVCQSIANQHSVIHWVRDHRLHHKYSDTDADPHNASRGFFFSHVGWLLVKKHPEVAKRGRLIDISDVRSNPILMFQHRHNMWFIPLVAFVLPSILPLWCWGETLNNAYHVTLFRYIVTVNVTFCINSIAHLYGDRPYDKTIGPAQNMTIYCITLGEGFHNYHHIFPCDYRSNEFGKVFNMMTSFIELCAWLGLAYDLRTVDEEVARARMKRTGDGTMPPRLEN